MLIKHLIDHLMNYALQLMELLLRKSHGVEAIVDENTGYQKAVIQYY